MSNGITKSVVYKVEARTSYPQPQEHCGMMLGHNWTEVQFSEARAFPGVPNQTFSNADRRGYLSYEAAQTLRWWFHAAGSASYCMETRLVAYDYKEEWAATKKSVSSVQDMPRRPFDEFEPVETPDV